MNCMAILMRIGSFLKEAVHLRMASFFFAKFAGLLIEEISNLNLKGGSIMNMFDFYKVILREVTRVWRPKYAFWWICIAIHMFVDTYNSFWLYYSGEPVTAARFNQALGINIIAGLIGLVGVVRLFKAWKEER